MTINQALHIAQIHTSPNDKCDDISNALRIVAVYARTLEDAIEEVRSLGIVYCVPDDWDYGAMGGPPDVEQMDEIDLSSF